jgi:hypothetical protein
MVANIKNNKITFDDLLAMGVIEFLDVNEEDNSYIALKPHELTTLHTHV